MIIKMKFDELTFYSEPQKVEAYRRAVEIREFSRERNGNSSQGRFEHFSWTTRTGQALEVEEVSIDNEEGTIIYRLTESPLIS